MTKRRSDRHPTDSAIETDEFDRLGSRASTPPPISTDTDRKWSSFSRLPAVGGTQETLDEKKRRILNRLAQQDPNFPETDSLTDIVTTVQTSRQEILRNTSLDTFDRSGPNQLRQGGHQRHEGHLNSMTLPAFIAEVQKPEWRSELDTQDRIKNPIGRPSALSSNAHIGFQSIPTDVFEQIKKSGYIARLFENQGKPGRGPRKFSFEQGDEGSYVIETYRSEDMAEILNKIAKEVSDFYRFIFNNQGHYLIYPKVGECFSPQDIFGKRKGEYVSLAEMDSLDPTKYERHPVTGELPMFWHDPEQTYFNLRKKLAKDADLTMVRDLTGEVMGMIFGKVSTLHEHYWSEEWGDPLRNSRFRNYEGFRSFDFFLEQVNEVLAKYPKFRDLIPGTGLNGSSRIYTWNTFATHPDSQAKGSTSKMMQDFFSSLPADRDLLVDVAEVRRGSKAAEIFTGAGFVQIWGFLSEDIPPKPGQSTIIAAPVRELRQNYTQYSIREIMKRTPTDENGMNVLGLENDLINLEIWMQGIVPEYFRDAFEVSNSYVIDHGRTMVISIEEKPVRGYRIAHTEQRSVVVEEYPSEGTRCILRFNLHGWVPDTPEQQETKMKFRGLRKDFEPQTPIDQAFAEVLQ